MANTKYRTSELNSIFKQENEGISNSAIELLQEWELIPKEGSYLCPNGHPFKLIKSSRAIDGWIWKCGARIPVQKRKAKRCDTSISLRKGTFFEKSHLQIQQIVLYVYLWIQNCSRALILNECRISQATATDWGSFCREVLVTKIFKDKEKIGGPGKIVEIDESKFGRRKYHRGHSVEGQWVFGGYERDTGKCFLVPVETRDRATLLKIIKAHIERGTTIISDCWKAYDCLENEGYKHLTVNHSINFKDPETGAHTNHIESTWRHVKAQLPQYMRKKQFFCGYLAKYVFTKHCKANNIDRFLEFFRWTRDVYNPLRQEDFVLVEEPKEQLEESPL